MIGSAERASDGGIGARVREARTRLQLTQAVLADRLAAEGLPLHSSAVAKIEAGERGLRLAEGPAMARALGVSVAWLAGEVEDMPPLVVDSRAEQALRRVKRIVDLALPEGQMAELERMKAALVEFAVNAGTDFQKVQPVLASIEQQLAELRQQAQDNN